MINTNPVATPVPLGLRPSFGFGDRLGLGTPGHVEAMRRAGQGIAPDLSAAVDPRDDADQSLARGGDVATR